MRATVLFSLVSLVLIAPASAQQRISADSGSTVRVTVAESGRRLKGQVVRATVDSVVIRARRGSVTALSLDDVRKIEVRVPRAWDSDAAREHALRGALAGAAPGISMLLDGEERGAAVALIGAPVGAAIGFALGGKGRVARDGMFTGALYGAVLGVAAGLASYGDDDCPGDCPFEFGPGFYVLAAGTLGAGLGSVVGLGISLTRPGYDWETTYPRGPTVAVRHLRQGRTGVGVRIPLRLSN